MAISAHLEEVIRLVTQTGDRCIVVSDSGDPIVIMDLAAYKTLLETAASKQNIGRLTESELLERINQQIAEWRESQAHELSDYELTQFQVAERSKALKNVRKSPQPTIRDALANSVTPPLPTQVSPARQPNFSTREVLVGKPSDTLPIVEDASEEEFALEPLN